jgi:hypothetical protein
MTKIQKILIVPIVLLLSIIIIWWVVADDLIDYLLNKSNISLLKYHQSLNPAERSFIYYKQLVWSGLLRFSFFWSSIVIFLFFFWVKIQNRLNSFLNEEHSPYALSIFRIITFVTILIYTEYNLILKISSLPHQLLVPPLGWSQILSYLKPNTYSLTYLIPIFQITVFLSILGYRVRFFGSIAIILGIWILGIPQFYGKINHYHHLLWFALIAVVSPSTEVWALDNKERKVITNGYVHRYYLQLILLSLIVIYFFAGAWKLIGGGLEWLWGDAARRQIELESVSLGIKLPSIFNAIPVLYKLIGLLTVFIELSWGWWMLNKKTRIWTIVITAIFHLCIFLIMDINFWILPVFLLTFLPFKTFFPSNPSNKNIQEPVKVISFSSRHWSKLYLSVIILFGFFHIDTWPFAVYPSFGNPIESKSWQVSMQYQEAGIKQNINLISNKKLREWLTKSRLYGLHNQISQGNETSNSKLKILDTFYCRKLGIPANKNREYIKYKINVVTGEKLDSIVLLKLP